MGRSCFDFSLELLVTKARQDSQCVFAQHVVREIPMSAKTSIDRLPISSKSCTHYLKIQSVRAYSPLSLEDFGVAVVFGKVHEVVGPRP